MTVRLMVESTFSSPLYIFFSFFFETDVLHLSDGLQKNGKIESSVESHKSGITSVSSSVTKLTHDESHGENGLDNTASPFFDMHNVSRMVWLSTLITI